MPKTTQSSIWQNHKSLFFGHLFDFIFGSRLSIRFFCCSKFSRRCQIFPFNCFCEPFVNLFLKDFTHSIFRKIPPNSSSILSKLRTLFCIDSNAKKQKGKKSHLITFRKSQNSIFENLDFYKIHLLKIAHLTNSHLWSSFLDFS